jgi:hypothetical protein
MQFKKSSVFELMGTNDAQFLSYGIVSYRIVSYRIVSYRIVSSVLFVSNFVLRWGDCEIVVTIANINGSIAHSVGYVNRCLSCGEWICLFFFFVFALIDLASPFILEPQEEGVSAVQAQAE